MARAKDWTPPTPVSRARAKYLLDTMVDGYFRFNWLRTVTHEVYEDGITKSENQFIKMVWGRKGRSTYYDAVVRIFNGTDGKKYKCTPPRAT